MVVNTVDKTTIGKIGSNRAISNIKEFLIVITHKNYMKENGNHIEVTTSKIG